MKVYMFVMNNCKHDARVLKEARSLARAGYRVRVIAVLDTQTRPYERRDDFEIIRVPKNPLHYRLWRFLSRLKTQLGRSARLRFSRLRRRARYWLRISWRWFVQIGRRFWLITRRFAARCRWLVQLRPRPLLPDVRKARRGPVALLTFLGVKFASTVAKCLRKATLLLMGIPLKLVFALPQAGARLVRALSTRLKAFSERLFRVVHRPLSYLDYYLRAYSLAKEDPGAIYHAHDLNTLPVAWWAKRRFGGKLVYDSHELYLEGSGISRLERCLFRPMERHLISECDAVITVSNSIAAELRSRYGTLQTPVILMNCPEVSNDISPSTSFHRLLGLSDDEPILLYQGGYIKGRGLLTLIRAIEHIPKGHLVLMGWGKMEPELRALAASLGLLDRRVFFVSPVPQDELLRWTSTASVGVIPTQRVSLNNWYTLPNKLFEYIAAGLPVAASNFPEIRRVIEDYQVGCTFNPEDPEDIARAVQDVLVPHRFALFKKNTREAAKVFNWGVEETKLLELYSHLRF